MVEPTTIRYRLSQHGLDGVAQHGLDCAALRCFFRLRRARNAMLTLLSGARLGHSEDTGRLRPRQARLDAAWLTRGRVGEGAARRVGVGRPRRSRAGVTPLAACHGSTGEDTTLRI